VSPALRYVRYVASAVAPVPFVNRMTLLKSAILHRFPNVYTLRVDIFRNVFPFKYTYDPYEPLKFHGNRSVRFSGIRNTDTQMDRRGNFIYIDVLDILCCLSRITNELGEVYVTSITCVMFSNNQLTDLPADLVSLHLLRELAISYNRYNPVAKLYNN